MTYIPLPKNSILAKLESYVYDGEKRWRSHDGNRIYTWDGLHGEVEVFNKRGRHLHVLDPRSGKVIKEAIKGRKIDV